MSITRFYTMETTTTNRGGVKLCHGRYTYTKKATNKSTIYIIQMGANDRGAIDHRGKRPGGKRPGGK